MDEILAAFKRREPRENRKKLRIKHGRLVENLLNSGALKQA